MICRYVVFFLIKSMLLVFQKIIKTSKELLVHCIIKSEIYFKFIYLGEHPFITNSVFKTFNIFFNFANFKYNVTKKNSQYM